MKRRQQHKKFIKEAVTRNNQALEKLMTLVEYYGDLRQGAGRAQATRQDTEYYKKKAQQTLEDIKEHAESFMSYTAYNGKEEFDESGIESGWFDERGELVKPLPGQCIEDCSGSGRVDDQVAYWVDELGFDIDLPRDKAIKFLSEYGAWESDELENMDIIELAEKVLWIFCGNIKEDAYEQSRDETSLVYDWGEVSNWDDEDWEKFQKEYSYCSLNS